MKKKYSKNRPNIPAAVKRTIKLEARYACAICKGRVALTHHHIDGNRENNDPDNIIYICSNCHSLIHSGNIPHVDVVACKKKSKETDQEIIKLKQTVDYMTKGRRPSISSDYYQLKLKYQNKISVFVENLIFYQSFIYLVPAFYIDERGLMVRDFVRGVLRISKADENMIIQYLEKQGIINCVGGLISLKDSSDAKAGLNELIESGDLDLDKLIDIF
jgi:hypothetical protein